MAPDPLGPGSDDLVHRPLWLRLALPVLLLAMGLGFGALGGTVTDAATSDPIPGATVSCGTPNTTGADGSYLFYVPTGEGYTVAAGAPAYATERLTNVDVPAGQLVQLDFALELMDFGSIGGTVTNARTAQPIAAAPRRRCWMKRPSPPARKRATSAPSPIAAWAETNPTTASRVP